MVTEPMQEEVIPLHAHILPDVQRLCLLIAHHEALLNGLQQELGRLLLVGQNIDVSQPGWHLNPFSGVIVHRVPVLVPVTPVVAVEQNSHEPEEAVPAASDTAATAKRTKADDA